MRTARILLTAVLYIPVLLYPLSRPGVTIAIANRAPSARVLLYVTTHMSVAHFRILQSCWPEVLARSSLLRGADVAVYLTAPAHSREMAVEQLNHTFRDQDLVIRGPPDNPGYQEGAMAALSDAIQNKWFDGYDWVIRLNPDVVVRDDAFLVDAIANDPNATALLIDCIPQGFNKNKLMSFMRSWEGPLIHTDFFALKPSALPGTTFLHPGKVAAAEVAFTDDIREPILSRGGHRFVPGTGPLGNAVCRSGFGRAAEDAPVFHLHVEGEDPQVTCPF